MPLRVWTDSTATIGICSRDGLGKLRHIDTQCLWLQQKVRDGKLELRKIKGTENPADIFTKHFSSAPTIEALLKLFGCEYREGRPRGAPALRKGRGNEAGERLDPVEVAYVRGTEADEERLLGGAVDMPRIIQQKESWFPTELWEGIWVPEARSYRQTALPHLAVSCLDDYFPKAVAPTDRGGLDVHEGEDVWEVAGRSKPQETTR